MIPVRMGIPDTAWSRLLAPYDTARQRVLQRLSDREEAGGAVALWARGTRGLERETLAIQPGMADDLPSLLSALAPLLGWPGAPAPERPTEVVGVWARAWQVREAADLRLLLHWDAQGTFHASAERCTPRGEVTPWLDTPAVAALLDRVAVTPAASTSPHGLLLAGNRAMQAGDFAAAREAYTRAARDLPRHMEVRRNLALALAQQEAWEEAAAVMREALALAPDDAGLAQEYLALETDGGVRAVQAGDLPRAAAHFLRILDRWPEEPTALANLGNIRWREGRIPEARAIFQRFLRHHPSHPAAEQVRLLLAELETT